MSRPVIELLRTVVELPGAIVKLPRAIIELARSFLKLVGPARGSGIRTSIGPEPVRATLIAVRSALVTEWLSLCGRSRIASFVTIG